MLFNTPKIREYCAKNDSVVLIDGTNMFCRCSLAESKASVSNTLAVFLRMLDKALSEKPKYVALVFDSGNENFRHMLYPEYKANRKRSYIASEEIKLQSVKQVCKALGFAVFESKQVEADDVIGALARFCKNYSVTIVSEDKDFLQLVNENTFLIKGGLKYTPKVCEAKYGVTPKQFVEYLSLIGDSSDNIKGAKGWGSKTSSEYLQKHSDIETIQKLELPKGLQSVKTFDYKLNKKLIKIKSNLKVIKDVNKLSVRKPDKNVLVQYFEKYGLMYSVLS